MGISKHHKNEGNFRLMATWTSNGLDIGGANPSLSVSFILANNAHTGDTIIIPAGYYTWQTGVTISIGVTLLGQGSVFITCNGGGVGAGNAATATIITANSGTDGHIHIQNIQFYIITTATAGHYPINAGRSLSSSTNPFTVIIQNCVFNNAQIYTYAILTLSNGIIISGCTFIGSGDNGNAGINFQCVAYENASPAPPAYWNYPDTMGATPTQYGTGDVQTFAAPAGLNNIYVEDCVAYDCSVASNNGDDHARIVYRHNSHYNATIFYTHGQDSSTYGPRHWEIYNNTANGNATNWTFATSFTQPAPGSSVTITLNNTTNMIPMVCIGLYNIYTVSNITSNQVTLKNVGWPLSSATGATISAGTIYGPSGSGGGTFPYNWNGWIFHRGGTGIIFNNTAPTLASIMGFPRAPIVFTVQQINRTGQFSCQTAYPANRQIGIGWSAGSSTPYGHPSVPSDGVGQVVNPIYIWGNSNAFANTSADVSLDQFTPDQCGNGQIVGTYLQSGR